MIRRKVGAARKEGAEGKGHILFPECQPANIPVKENTSVIHRL